MARILLLTRHFNDNNGTVLQVYATCKILESLGHSVSVVNLTDRYFFRNLLNFRTILSIVRIFKFFLFRKKHFPGLTHVCRCLNELSLPEADYFVVGSDQVWNRKITKSLFFDYFLTSIPETYKKISLSSSFGMQEWNETKEVTEIIKGTLEKFSAISVREDSGVEICHNIFNINAVQLVDPTLALRDFSCFIKKKEIKDEVSFYSFCPNGYVQEIVDYISRKENLKIRTLTYNANHKYLGSHVRSLGPIDWLNYINQSKIFVTDSFHGVVFSILLKKQFIALQAFKERNTRIVSLLKLLKIKNKFVASKAEFIENYSSIIQPIDYNVVDLILDEKQTEFFSFVKSNII